MAIVERLFPGWTADQALRYLPIARELGRVAGRDELIAEIGSGSLGITPYWPGRVVGVDVAFDGTPAPTLWPLRGSCACLPFRTGAFPAVVCSDVIEHVPPALREAMLRELVRVARRHVFLVYPADSPETRAAEDAWNRAYREATGEENRWLLEHRENGLPDSAFVHRVLRDAAGSGAELRARPNVSLGVWLRINASFYSRTWLVKKVLGSHTLQVLAIPLLRLCNSRPAYRELILLDKQPTGRGCACNCREAESR
ncbi:MAG: class I SAM-dependent methyltransferase [Candidatus Riflebacteria bacterium]|nr:class I SAM-dependent methyltransferase [Candidatus Riflebacteria bacterium]